MHLSAGKTPPPRAEVPYNGSTCVRICETALIHMCAMTRAYVCHDSLICVDDSFMCVP